MELPSLSVSTKQLSKNLRDMLESAATLRLTNLFMEAKWLEYQRTNQEVLGSTLAGCSAFFL